MKNQQIIESIIAMLAIDGDFNKHEMRFLRDMCQRLKVSKKLRDKILERARAGKGKVHLPDDEDDRKRLLYFLMQAVVADGKIEPDERRVLNIVAQNFGMPTDEIDEFIQERIGEVKSDLYTSVKKKPAMKCPKCGHEQPKSFKCRRCGIIFKKWQEAQEPTDEDRLMEILASSNVIKNQPSED